MMGLSNNDTSATVSSSLSYLLLIGTLLYFLNKKFGKTAKNWYIALQIVNDCKDS